MKIVGIDFTSAPKRDKKIVVAECSLNESLELKKYLSFGDWPAYEHWLGAEDQWFGGFDFPFGLPKKFVDDQGWPNTWPEMIRACVKGGKESFVALGMKAFMAATCREDKHRMTDLKADSHSPLKTNTNPPVGKMFYEGTWRLLSHGIHIPILNETGSKKVAVEAYPGYLARQIGHRQYKNDKPHNAKKNLGARQQIVRALQSGNHPLKTKVIIPADLLSQTIDDPQGDTLDALLCAVQASWAHQSPAHGFPSEFHACEGWIAGA